MYIYKFRACGLFRFSRRRAPDVYTPRPWIAKCSVRFNRIIICFLSQFYLYHSNRTTTGARIFTIALINHLGPRASRSRPTISSCCFLCQKSTPRFGIALCNFSHIASIALCPPPLLLSPRISYCLSSSSPSPSSRHSGSVVSVAM